MLPGPMFTVNEAGDVGEQFDKRIQHENLPGKTRAQYRIKKPAGNWHESAIIIADAVKHYKLHGLAGHAVPDCAL